MKYNVIHLITNLIAATFAIKVEGKKTAKNLKCDRYSQVTALRFAAPLP